MRNRCWPTTFHTITTGDDDEWPQKWTVRLTPRLVHTPSVSKQKLRFTKSMGLRSFFAFLARNRVRCIALTKRFPVS
jgi:hypothetical protein